MGLLAIVAILLSMALYILLPPMLDGIERKIKADIQSRLGPPTVLQTWYDILKLMSKEIIIPIGAGWVAVSAALLFSLSIPLIFFSSYTTVIGTIEFKDVVAILVLLMSIHTLSLLMYVLSSNPFSIIGTFRIVVLDLLNELGLVTFLTLTAIVILTDILTNIMLFVLAVIPLAIAVYVSHRRLPYDLHEAEPELASGALIEFSGPILGLYLYTHLIERYTLTSLLVIPILYVARLIPQLNPIATVVLLHILTVCIYMIFAVVSILMGRSKVNLAVKTLASIYVLTIILWMSVYILWRYHLT